MRFTIGVLLASTPSTSVPHLRVELSRSILHANLQISAQLATQLNSKLHSSHLLHKWQTLRDTKRKIRSIKLEIEARTQSLEGLEIKINALKSNYQKCVVSYSQSL